MTISPFEYRYGSQEMREIWTLERQRLTWRKLWMSIAEVHNKLGLVSDAQLQDLQKGRVDIAQSLEYERELGHDLVAELQVFTEQCPIGGNILHLCLTSADIKDNADVLLQQEALEIVLRKLRSLLFTLIEQVERHSETVCMGYTHL